MKSWPEAAVAADAWPPGAGPAQAAPRLQALDALRGAAIVWMVAYHFCFDLNLYGWLQPRQRFNADPFWTLQRTAIVGLFLLCAGAGQALAEAAGQGWPRFWRRWAQVAGCAIAVSIGSWWMFPGSWIHFGVLHGMAVMLVLTRLLAPRLPVPALLLIGLALVLLPQGAQHPFFDSRWTDWVGLMTRKPVTQDHVPLLPWWGVMLWGLALGRLAIRRSALRRSAIPRVATGRLAKADPGAAPTGPSQPAAAPGGAFARVQAALAFLGRWPLTVYMLHQPLLLGALWAVDRLRA